MSLMSQHSGLGVTQNASPLNGLRLATYECACTGFDKYSFIAATDGQLRTHGVFIIVDTCCHRD